MDYLVAGHWVEIAGDYDRGHILLRAPQGGLHNISASGSGNTARGVIAEIRSNSTRGVARVAAIYSSRAVREREKRWQHWRGDGD